MDRFRRVLAEMDTCRRGGIIFAEFSQKWTDFAGRDHFGRIFAKFSQKWTDFAGDGPFWQNFRRHGRFRRGGLFSQILRRNRQIFRRGGSIFAKFSQRRKDSQFFPKLFAEEGSLSQNFRRNGKNRHFSGGFSAGKGNIFEEFSQSSFFRRLFAGKGTFSHNFRRKGQISPCFQRLFAWGGIMFADRRKDFAVLLFVLGPSVSPWYMVMSSPPLQ